MAVDKSSKTSGDVTLNINYELFIAALSVLSVGNIFLLHLVKNSTIDGVIQIMDILFSLIFLIDFSYRISISKSKREYFFKKFGWADLLASLPFPQFKILRLFRIIRAGRIVRKYGTRKIVRLFLASRGASALLTILFLAVCVLEFGGMAILWAEGASTEANIKTPSDAIWWIVVTITTVGYGDRFPVTNWGRFVGVIVMITGIGVFGTLTGFLANAFLEPKKQ